jgi:hypothetical protein
MDRRDLDEIERFLTSVGRATLFAYYDVPIELGGAEADAVVKKRRAWAQGQQSNPKFKSEALFLIKNNSLLRRVFVEQLEDYREHVRGDSASRNLEVLSLFIRGSLSAGELTPQAEAAILHQGRQLELSEVAVARRIEELLAETGLSRSGLEPDDLSAEATSVDYYMMLGIPVSAPTSAIEEAYRSRYRWARNLKDLKRSADVLEKLDEAWRILSDPKRRARYDERRSEMFEATDEVEKRAAALLGLLGGPEDTNETPRAAASAENTGSVHEVGFRPRATPPPPSPPQPTQVPSPPSPSPISVPEPSNRAPAPPSVSGRTIGLAQGPQAVATLGARLAVDGPEVYKIAVGGRAVERRLTIRNVGHGKMPGRVVTDRVWLKVPQPRLDPAAAEQVITVVVDPAEMPWGNSGGTVTVVTDHGERRIVTFNVSRRSWLPLLGLAVAGVLLAGLAIVAFLLYRPAPPPHAAAGALLLSVDPIADSITVDDQAIGKGAAVRIADPHPGRAFKLHVEAEGFTPFDDLISLPEGRETARTVRLELSDDMTWTPPRGEVATPLAPGAAELLDAARAGLGGCFVGVEGIQEAIAMYSATVTGDGQVRRVDVTVPNFALGPAEPCIHRVFRGLRLPAFKGGHAVIEARLAVPVTR